MNATTNETRTGPAGQTRFIRTFLALLSLGLLGVLSAVPTITGQLDALPPELADLPAPVMVLLALFNLMMLLVIAVAVGTLLGHRVGFRSLVADRIRQGTAIWPQLRPHVAMAFVAGIVFAVVLLGLDAIIDPFANTDLLNETSTAEGLFVNLLAGLLYGGIVEELLMRWGVVSLLVWIGWRIAQRGQGEPGPALVWMAIILVALLFGIGHLPALAILVPLTPLIVLRTILLNALGGVLFGWLFWQRSLEVAMVAHAAAHVGFFIVNAGLLVLGG